MRPGVLLIYLLLLAGFVACGPVVPGLEDTGAASTMTGVISTTETPTAEASTMAALTTGGSTESTESTEPLVSTGSSTGEAEAGVFISRPDGFIVDPCNIFEQDCPTGMKCMPYADDGGSSWNSDKCVPVVDDPKQLGESCFAAEGGVGGVDDCDLGLMCWNVDVEKMGICFELCGGSPDAATCKAPKTSCTVYSQATLALCLPVCNPVVQDCGPSDVCIANPSGGAFLCVPDASGDEGQLHDPCLFANACDPGLQCVDPAWAVECDQLEVSCCEPFCDITLPNMCPGVGQVCNASFEEGTAPVGYENVGYCAVPE